MCTDSDDVLHPGNTYIGHNTSAIIPRLNFTCNGRITRIRARMWFNDRNDYPYFQVWRSASVGSTIYNKVGEVQLQSDDQVYEVNNNVRIATIILTGANAIEVQSGDVVGYYHPPSARLRVITRRTNGYILYQFSGSPDYVDLNNAVGMNNERQPVIQFTIGKHHYNTSPMTFIVYFQLC